MSTVGSLFFIPLETTHQHFDLRRGVVVDKAAQIKLGLFHFNVHGGGGGGGGWNAHLLKNHGGRVSR